MDYSYCSYRILANYISWGMGNAQFQFKSGLSMAGLNLTPEELQVLAESYANPEDPQLRVSHTCATLYLVWRFMFKTLFTRNRCP